MVTTFRPCLVFTDNVTGGKVPFLPDINIRPRSPLKVGNNDHIPYLPSNRDGPAHTSAQPTDDLFPTEFIYTPRFDCIGQGLIEKDESLITRVGEIMTQDICLDGGFERAGRV